MAAMLPRGSIDVHRLDDTTFEWTVRGYVDAALADDALDRAAAILDGMHGRVDSLSDLRGFEAFSPGVPIRGIRWAQQRIQRLRRVAIVVSNQFIAAVMGTYPVLLSDLSIRFFRDRRRALAWLAEA